MRISIFGDSILEGVRLEKGRYVRSTELIQQFQSENNVELNNKSRFGATIGRGLRSLHKSLEKGNLGEYTVIEFGGNDCNHNWAQVAQNPSQQHICATPEEEFERQYVQMIQEIRGADSIPVAATLPPISAEHYLDWICRTGLDRQAILQWLGGVQTLARRQALFNDISRNVAQKMECPVLDLRGAFPEKQEKTEQYLCRDGIHPNFQGQQLIYNRFSEAVAAMKAS